MTTNNECKPMELLDIWRTCNKIRAAIFRNGFNLWDLYKPLDTSNSHVLSECKFVSVLAGNLKHLIGLCDQEITELCDYFRAPDGTILYSQFCHVIHDNLPDLKTNNALMSGLEWEDPYHVNSMSMSEERKLKILLTKIATVVKAKNLILQPYFQDYELIAKNNGTVTITHFARTLHFLKIFLSIEDFNLLVKKFMKDKYTINYVAFVYALDYVYKYFEKCAITDLSGDVLPLFPGRTITADFPKLPRPEIGHIRTDSVFGGQKIFHPVLNPQIDMESLDIVIRRIQKYVLTRGVRIKDFFMDFDVTNCGRVTEEIFRRCLDTIGIGESGLCHLYLAPFEVESIINTYRDPNDSSRILWKVFSQDIESVINKVGLEKRPDIIIDHTLQEITELPPKGNMYSNADDLEISTLESIVTKMKKKIQTRGIDMEKDFKDYDKLTTGHVTRNQFRQVLQLNCFLLPDENIFLLERRYIDELGFNYFKFLKDLTFENDCSPRYKLIQDARVKLNAKHFAMTPHPNEKNIVEILAKIKKKLICYKIRLYTFLKQFDPLNRFIISRDDFYRAMDPKLELTETEVHTIMDVFASPLNNCFVEYKRFCETVEETFTLLQLDRAPLLEPVQHVMISDGDHNFLNFEERQGLSLALQKISEQRTEGLIDIIKQYDQCNCGTVSHINFLRALTTCNLHSVISNCELNLIMKCFNKPRGLRDEVDYRSFIDTIRIIKQNKNK